MPFLDEVLELLPTVNLTVWQMHQGESKEWHCVLQDETTHPISLYVGDGDTAAGAVTAALSRAGVQIDD